MKTQHTQGEWVAFESGVNVQGEDNMHEVHAYTPDGQLVMICQAGEGYFSEHGKDGEYHLTIAEALANAHLIAAAPDMLKLLIHYANTYPDALVSDMAESVISKAKGEKL